MKKKLGLLFTGFIIFYFLLHAGKQLPSILHGRSGWVTDAGDRPMLVTLLTDMLVSAGFVFAIYSILFYGYRRKKIVRMLLFSLFSFIILFALAYFLTLYTTPYGLRINIFFRNNILYFVLYSAFGATWYFIRYAQYRELRETAMELAARKTELSFLRAQMNPHFLFNNLNNIYSLVHEKSEAALPAISALSEMLRYVLYEINERVPLKTELACIDQYISLENLRREKPVPVNIIIKGDIHQHFIAPLLLLPLVENAYKHGDAEKAADWLSIELNAESKELSFRITNKKNNRPSTVPGGLGLIQLAKRLELVYPEKYDLHIDDTDKFFTVTLTISHGH